MRGWGGSRKRRRRELLRGGELFFEETLPTEERVDERRGVMGGREEGECGERATHVMVGNDN